MALSPLPGAYNQVTWPGVGDIDDCQVLAAFWAVVAAGWSSKANLPSVSKFRYEAGNPDDPARIDGLTNSQSLRAIQRIWPTAKATSYVGDMVGFKLRVRTNGSVASVSVKSSLLPSSMRFDFGGLHQIAIAYDGQPLLMNPLQKQGARPIPITWAQLRIAAEAVYNDGKIHAVIVPAKPAPVIPPPPTVDPTVALRAEIEALKAKVAERDATIAALTAKIAAARVALT